MTSSHLQLQPVPIRFSTADGCELEGDWFDAHDPGADSAVLPVAVAVVTHPHPRYGGDRHNAVTDALFRRLAAHRITTLRFDFRGTGRSSGQHGGGRAEIGDVVAALDEAVARVPGVPVVVAGYSFGADVLLATADERIAAVVAVAPPLSVLEEEVLAAPRSEHRPTLVLAPEHDQFCPPERAATHTASWPATEVRAISGGDHFLAGRAVVAADAAAVWLLERFDAG